MVLKFDAVGGYSEEQLMADLSLFWGCFLSARRELGRHDSKRCIIGRETDRGGHSYACRGFDSGYCGGGSI
jgi:hypothetical protein